MNLILTDLIKEQVFQCAVMLGAGIAFMLFYQTGTAVCRILQPGKKLKWLLELVFWLTGAVMTAQFLYYCAYGRVSVHAIAAFTAGVLLWKVCFYDIINKVYFQRKTVRGLGKRYGKKEKKQSVQRQQPGNRH